MTMIKIFIVTLISMLVLDIFWLGFVAKNLYANQLGHLMRQSGGQFSPIWLSALLVYMIMAAGILCFVLPKADGNEMMALFWGGVLGAVIYGVYDFTNHAILKHWPLKITLIDLCWGIILCGVVSMIASFVKNHYLS